MSELALQLYGKNLELGTLSEALGHLHGLLREVTREATGDPDAIRWMVGNLRIVCDWCERDRPVKHGGWVNDGRHDYCPGCAAWLAARASS